MRTRSFWTLPLLLTLLLAGQAGAQGELLEGGLRPFTALPQQDLRTRFDLTAIDYTKELPADYRLGAGDLIVVDLGNLAGDQQQLVVSPQGDIFVPVVGKVDVQGMTVQEAADHLTVAMTPYFRNFELGITVGRVRKIEVSLSGMVALPGTYIAYGGTTLSHFVQIICQRFSEEPLASFQSPNELIARTNTRFRALLPEGSYRRVMVYRKGSLYKTIDLAKLMLFGQYDHDFLLEQGDRVHVPALQDYIVFDHSVPFAGKIELLANDRLPELIKMAGGPENFAVEDIVEAQIERGSDAGFFQVRVRDGVIVDAVRMQEPQTGQRPSHRGQQAIEAAYAQHAEQVASLPAGLQPGQQFPLQSGTLIRLPKARDVVYLVGAWARPGAYAYRPEHTLLDYIGQAGGFFPGAQEGEARWIRPGATGDPWQVQYISMKSMMLGEAVPPQLRPGDMIVIPLRNNQWPGPALISTLLNFGTQLRIFTD